MQKVVEILTIESIRLASAVFGFPPAAPSTRARCARWSCVTSDSCSRMQKVVEILINALKPEALNHLKP